MGRRRLGTGFFAGPPATPVIGDRDPAGSRCLGPIHLAALPDHRRFIAGGKGPLLTGDWLELPVPGDLVTGLSGVAASS